MGSAEADPAHPTVMSHRDAAGRNRVTRMTADGTVKNVWSETPRAEAGDLALDERPDDVSPFHPITGDDISRLYHGSGATAFELHLNGLEPRDGLTDEGMLGEGVTHAVFLTTDYDEALSYGKTVVQVDARGMDLIVVDGPDGYHYASTEPINPMRLTEPRSPEPTGFEDVLDHNVRADCVAYARRHAAGPRNPARYTPDWDHAFTKPTYELEAGDRIEQGVVTRVEEIPGSLVLVCVDGESMASVSLDYDAAATVHNDGVDLSDPDWFEAEAQRITKKRIAAARESGLTVNRMQAHDTDLQVRSDLIRLFQPGRANSLSDTHPDACHGRAKVGQNVIFEQVGGNANGTGPRSYRVVGKRATKTVMHDGARAFDVEDGGVEYVLTDLRTGNQTMTSMRQAGWRYTGE